RDPVLDLTAGRFHGSVHTLGEGRVDSFHRRDEAIANFLDRVGRMQGCSSPMTRAIQLLATNKCPLVSSTATTNSRNESDAGGAALGRKSVTSPPAGGIGA